MQCLQFVGLRIFNQESTIASFTQSHNISMAQYDILWLINGITMILVAQPLIKPILYLLKET